MFYSEHVTRVPNSAARLIYYYCIHPFNGLFSRTTWLSRYQKGKTSLDLNEARDYGVCDGSGVSRTIWKQSAPHSRQNLTNINTQFTSRMLFLTTNQQCQSTDGTLARIVISVKKFNSLKYGVRSQVTLIKWQKPFSHLVHEWCIIIHQAP